MIIALITAVIIPPTTINSLIVRLEMLLLTIILTYHQSIKAIQIILLTQPIQAQRNNIHWITHPAMTVVSDQHTYLRNHSSSNILTRQHKNSLRILGLIKCF